MLMFAKIKSFFLYFLYFDQKRPTLYRLLRLVLAVWVVTTLTGIDERMEEIAVDHADEVSQKVDDLSYEVEDIKVFIENLRSY